MNFQLIYEQILESNIINFLIMVSILVFIFKKCRLGDLIDAMADEIKNNVDISYKNVENAKKRYKETELEAKKTEQKKEEISKNSKELIQKLQEKNGFEIEKKTKDIEENLNKTKENILSSKVQKVTKTVQEAVYLCSVDTIKNMLNYDMQKKIILESLDELDDFSFIQEGRR